VRKNKNWLHVCKYFYDSTVHRDLILSLAGSHFGIYKIFVADHRLSPVEEINPNVTYFKYPVFLRYFLILRSFYGLTNSLRSIEVRDFDVIFCHTWIVDGIYGYFLNKVFDVPYVVLVRNTDINFYFRYMRHLRWFFVKIIKSASMVGFVSHANMELFSEKVGAIIPDQKKLIWPNGLNKFWLGQLSERNQSVRSESYRSSNRASKVLFVGRYDQNKNLKGVFGGVSLLRSQGYDVELLCVGDDLNFLCKCLGFSIDELPTWITSLGKLSREELLYYYRESTCLCVPSFRETFGLVYLEALSQYLPVVLSKGQGIDGFFTNGVFSVDPKVTLDIADGILSAIDYRGDYPDLSSFSWVDIGCLVNDDVSSFL
jgi:glycosyltransferase involved in cell wall biosynthesis